MEDILDLSGGIRVYIREWLDSKIYLPSIFFRKVYYPSDIVGPLGSALNQWKLMDVQNGDTNVIVVIETL